MTSEEEVALYLEDDKALGRFVSALEACGYIPVNPRTQVAKRGEVAAYRRRYSGRKGRDKQIHVQIVKARNPGSAYWVFAHTEPYAGKLIKHLISAVFSLHDYADGAHLLCKDLGLPTP
jgi:hypothetical protein